MGAAFAVADEPLQRAIDRAFESGEGSRQELVLVRGGEERRFGTQVVPLGAGEPVELVAVTGTDVTDAVRDEQSAERERRFLEALDRVNRVILASDAVESMLEEVLEAMLSIFGCDRAWLLFPCDPSAPSWTVPMERTRPAWPGVAATGVEIPMGGFARRQFERALSAPGALCWDRDEVVTASDADVMARFHVRSQLMMAIRPRVGAPWLLGIHHCEEERDYVEDAALFETIGRRMADSLSSLLAQRHLRDSEARFRALVEHAPEAIVILDADSDCFIDANENALRLFGRSRDELRQLGPADVSPERQPDGSSSLRRARDKVERALAGSRPVFDWVHLGAGGREIPCEVRLLRLPDPERQLVRGSITDVSGRRAAEIERAELTARLHQAQKMEAIGHLTGGVAHDFNNLLTVIGGNLELLADRVEGGSTQLVESARAAAQRAAALTQRLLAFSRKQTLHPKVVDLRQLLAEMQPIVASTLGATIEAEVFAASDLWLCRVDRAQLENALLNLVINARDAMPEGGSLSVAADNSILDREDVEGQDDLAAGRYVRLTVADSGQGMVSDVASRAFEPFFTTKETGAGSGLGLSMVYGFVKQSRGHVRLRTEPGAGCRVEVFLPCAGADEQVDEPEPEREEDWRGRGELILVVEDDLEVQALAVAALESVGYRTCAVAHARDAIDVLRDDRDVKLLFTDVVLPGGMSGVELGRAARALRPEVPVLFASGYPGRELAPRARPAADRLLLKPYSRSELARRVRALLGVPPGRS